MGGESRRMGTPKQDVALPCGQTMLEHVLGFAREAAANTVVVGGEIADCQCIPDLREGLGPVAGIEALLESGMDDRYLVVGCDMVRLSVEIVMPLLQANQTAVYSKQGTVISLPLLIHASVLDACIEYLDSGERSIKGFVARIPHIKIPISNDDLRLLHSINTLEDLNKLTVE